MSRYLDMVDGPEQVKKLTVPQLQELAGEIRTELIDGLAKGGGHLGPNLGVVELTIALHRVVRGEMPPLDRWAAAWGALVERHPALRTHFEEDAAGTLRRKTASSLVLGPRGGSEENAGLCSGLILALLSANI